MNPYLKRVLAGLAAVFIAEVALTILRACFPLKNFFDFVELCWGYSAVIGLQSGFGALAGVLAVRACK